MILSCHSLRFCTKWSKGHKGDRATRTCVFSTKPTLIVLGDATLDIGCVSGVPSTIATFNNVHEIALSGLSINVHSHNIHL